MTWTAPDAAEYTARTDVLTALARGGERLASSLVDQLHEEFGIAFAALIMDPSGKQLLPAGIAGDTDVTPDLVVPAHVGASAFVDTLTDAGAATWCVVPLPGSDSVVAALAPIALPGAGRSHGTIVAFDDPGATSRNEMLRSLESAAQVMALSIEAERDRRHRIPGPAIAASGLPGVAHVVAYIDRINGEPASATRAALYRISVTPGPHRAASDDDLGPDDLARIGAIVQQCLRPSDVVAHLGDDDFAVVTTDITVDADLAAVGLRIKEAIAGTGPDHDHPEGAYGARVGGVLLDGTRGPMMLLDAADRSRRENDERFGVADGTSPTADADASVSSISATELLAALRDGRIQPWYQPLFLLDRVETVGVEALARWVEHDGTVISPGEFIPAVTEHGLMSRLTACMLRQVTADLASWLRDGKVTHEFRASVNVSMSDVTGGMLPGLVRALLHENDLPARMLGLELTETEAMSDVDHTLAMLHELKELGVSLSIDDFGTGYSSLSYLSQLPVDVVKIDRAFVQGLHNRRGDDAIVGAVVDVADAVGLTVLAEGIETEDELDQLRNLGVRMGQGFLVSPAVRAEQLLIHLDEQSSHLL